MARRDEYNACVAEYLRNRSLTPQERRKEFCVASKICSGKAKDREEAERLCEISLTTPKPRKTRRGGSYMKLVLLTTSQCQPCEAAKTVLQKYIKSGEIEVRDVQTDDWAADLALRHDLRSVPKLLVVDKDGEPFAELPITE